MSLPLRKRTVHFYELTARASTRSDVTSPSCAPLPDLLNSFTALAKRTNLPQPIRRSSQLHTVLADWSYDKASGSYALLISKANAALSDVALRDLGTSRLRMANKTKVEGIEVSAHVLLRPNFDGKTAALLLTMGAGVSVTDVEMLLRHLARAAFADARNKDLFYFDHPSGAKDASGNPKQYRVSYSFEALPHRGQTLTTALESGEFQGMELIAHEHSPFDNGGNLEVTERSLSVQAKVPKIVTAAGIVNAVRTFIKQPQHDEYDKLRIHYKTVAGRPTSATLDIQDLGAAFTLKEYIEFDSDVEAQQSALSLVILAGMRPLLQSVPT